jgi:hypothetical protein
MTLGQFIDSIYQLTPMRGVRSQLDSVIFREEFGTIGLIFIDRHVTANHYRSGVSRFHIDGCPLDQAAALCGQIVSEADFNLLKMDEVQQKERKGR